MKARQALHLSQHLVASRAACLTARKRKRRRDQNPVDRAHGHHTQRRDQRIQASRRSYFQISRSVATSNSENAAEASTAPSAATGTYRSGSVRAGAPPRWLSLRRARSPACAPQRQRQLPCASPRRLRQSPAIARRRCWLPRRRQTRGRRRSGSHPSPRSCVRSTFHSVNTTSARPAAASCREGTSCSGTVGQRSCRSPAGTGPTPRHSCRQAPARQSPHRP